MFRQRHKYRIENFDSTGNDDYRASSYPGILFDIYTKEGFNALTRTALKRVLKAYLPDSIFDKLKLSSLEVNEPMDLEMIGHNAMVYITQVFEGSDELLAIYGSAEELVSNLKAFCSFTNSFEELWEPHRNCLDWDALDVSNVEVPAARWDARSEPFLTKQEAFIGLRNFLFEATLVEFADELLCLMLTLFLKYKEKSLKIDSTFEFFEKQSFVDVTIQKDMMIEDYYNYDKSTVPPITEPIKDVFQGLLDEYEVADDETRGALERYFDTEPPNEFDFKIIYSTLKFFFERLKRIIEGNRTVFSPNPVIKFMRVFSDGEREFVMVDEFVKVAGEDYRRGQRHPGYWRTLMTTEAYFLLNMNDNNIHFEVIPVPIVRAGRRAMPVYGPDGKLCKLAIDVFLELLDDLILGLRVFDKDVKNPKERVLKFLNKLPDIMDMKDTNMYFIREEKYVEINREVQETFADFKKDGTTYAFANVPISSGGVFKEALDALKELNIGDEFTEEEIRAAADIASPSSSGPSALEDYSTTDKLRMMSNAIKIMLIFKYEKFKTFFTNHNGPHRFLGTKILNYYVTKAAAEKAQWLRRKYLRLPVPFDDEDMIPELEVRNKRILTVDGPVLEGLSSGERELIKRAQDEWKAMKAALKDLDKKKISDNSRLDSLRAEIAERKARMNDLVTSKNATIEKLNDEKKMLEEKKKELELKLKMTPITRDVFDEIQEGIKTDKIQGRVHEMSVSVRKMRDAFVKEMDKFKETLNEHSKIIEKNTKLDPPTDLLPDVPEVTLEFVKSHLENSDNV